MKPALAAPARISDKSIRQQLDRVLASPTFQQVDRLKRFLTFITLEAIAGIVETADPKECGRREAFEEAGIRLKSMEHVGTTWTMPGVSTERMHLYLALYREADREGPGGGLAEEHEHTQPVEVALRELAAQADAGQLGDMKTALLVQTLRLRRPDLFA